MLFGIIQQKVRLLRALGKLPEALKICEKCVEDYENIGDEKLRSVDDLIRCLLYSQGEYSKALNYSENGLAFQVPKYNLPLGYNRLMSKGNLWMTFVKDWVADNGA